MSYIYRAPDGVNFSTSSADVILFAALTSCICLFVCCQLVEFHELHKVLLAKLKKIEPHLPADGQGGVTVLPVEALLHRPAALLRHELLDLLNGIRLELIQPLLNNRDQISAETKMRKEWIYSIEVYLLEYSPWQPWRSLKAGPPCRSSCTRWCFPASPPSP